MFAMLLAADGLYLLLGDKAEAFILLGFAGLSIVITIVQEARTERTLEALRDLSAPRALVIRDGEALRIAGREVVTGDILVLDAGDRIAGDALLLETQALEADESLLTGEAVPVRKRAAGPTDQEQAEPQLSRPPAPDPTFCNRPILGARNRKAALPHLAIKNWALNGRDGSELESVVNWA